MKKAPALLLAPLVLGAGLLAEDLYFQPEDGAVLERGFEVDFEITLSSVDLTQGGEPVDPSEILDGADVDDLGGSFLLEADLTDSYVRSRRGRALEFVREFGAFTMDGESAVEEDEDEVKKVRFTWSEDDERYALAAVDREDELTDEQRRGMEMMRADLDHVHLLPAGPVEPGETWTVELGMDGLVAAVLPFVSARGFLAMAREEAVAETDEPEAGELVELLFSELEAGLEGATCEVTYKGAREDSDTGRAIGVSDVEVEHTVSIDLSDALTEIMTRAMEEESGGEEMPGATIELVLELTVAGEGELAWDLAGRHLHHLDLPLDLEARIEGRFAIEIPGLGELEFVAGSATWEGTAAIEQTARRR